MPISVDDDLTFGTVRGMAWCWRGSLDCAKGGTSLLETYVPGFWSVKGVNSTVLMLILARLFCSMDEGVVLRKNIGSMSKR